MLLNLSDVLGEHHKTIEQCVMPEMTEFQADFGCFRVLSKDTVQLKVEHVKERQLMITGKGSLTFEIPCDRCLEPVAKEIALDFVKHVDLDLSDGEQPDEMDETNYIDGYELDVDQLIRNEVLIGWPTKILCSDDCKGICNVCGQNLNQGACDCEDTSLDPRMSVIRDVFKKFKEV